MNKKEEIFTIGDKTNNGTISKFELDSNGIRVFFEEKPKNHHVSLNSLSKVQQKLFRTEDGVDIFEGDTYWYVQTDENNGKSFPAAKAHFIWEVRSTSLKNNDILDLTNTNIKRFSTKSLAEEYNLMNKPCLSINDIQNTLANSNYSTNLKNRLKELVKSKS